MGGHDHHHHEPAIKIPDWRLMKVEECPPLLNVQKTLAARGLKDPWLRNHVWKYPPEVAGTKFGRIKRHISSGMKVGLALTVASLAIEYTYKFFVPPKDHHHH